MPSGKPFEVIRGYPPDDEAEVTALLVLLKSPPSASDVHVDEDEAPVAQLGGADDRGLEETPPNVPE